MVRVIVGLRVRRASRPTAGGRGAAGIADERKVADELAGGNFFLRNQAQFPAAGVVDRERDGVGVTARFGRESKVRGGHAEYHPARFRVAHLADEDRAISADARIESPAVDQAVAVVAQRTLHADAKADRALPRAEGAASTRPTRTLMTRFPVR